MLIKILQPKTISLQTIRDEIAIRLNIPSQRIEKVEYWQHQLWVLISGVGGRIISYRSLPAWLRQAIMLIKNCTNLEKLQELGNLIKLETQRFSQYYSEEKIQQIREFGAKDGANCENKKNGKHPNGNINKMVRNG